MILDYIGGEWKTKKKLLQEMKNNDIILNERVFRKLVEKQNELYANHLSDKFIVHSSKGYKLTSCPKEIMESIKDNHKRAMDLLIKTSKIKRALIENGNVNFDW